MVDAIEEGTAEARRALLIGCPVGGLTGVETDIERMREELRVRGFRCCEIVGPVATRQGILDALNELRDAARAEDAVVIYYSGHGGRCFVEEAGEATPAWSYLVPVDHDFERGFRGIADFELSAIVRDLSEKTQNVTVILDCCYASRMCRGDATTDRPWTYGSSATGTRSVGRLSAMPPEIAKSLEELERKHAPLPESNPDVVRVVATGSTSSAYEVRERAQKGGVFTKVLVEALAHGRTHEPMSWDGIVRWVREQIMLRRESSTQRAEVEGPRERLPFSLTVGGDMRSRLTVFRAADGSTRVEGGRLHGLAVDDRLDVLDGEELVAVRVQVIELHDDDAVVRVIAGFEGAAAPKPGLVAVRRDFGKRRPVVLDAGARGLASLIARIERAPWLRLVAEDPKVRLQVVLGDEGLCMPGFHRRPRPVSDAGIEALVEDLEGLARAEALDEALVSPPGLGLDAGSPWEAKPMVRVEPGEARALRAGELLHAGDEVYVEIRRDAAGGVPIYVNVIDENVSGRMYLVNQSEPAGVEVRPQDPRVIGQRPGRRPGLPTAWPAEIDGGLPEGEQELIVVVSLRPLDLRALLEDFPPPEKQRLRSAPGPAGPRPGGEHGPLMWDCKRFRFRLRGR